MILKILKILKMDSCLYLIIKVTLSLIETLLNLLTKPIIVTQFLVTMINSTYNLLLTIINLVYLIIKN